MKKLTFLLSLYEEERYYTLSDFLKAIVFLFLIMIIIAIFIDICKLIMAFLWKKCKEIEIYGRICKPEEKWEFLGYNSLRTAIFYYIPSSISVSGDIIRVWVRQEYSIDKKREIMENFEIIMKNNFEIMRILRLARIFAKLLYKNLDHSLVLYEIDCAKKRFRELSFIDYASDGSIINSRTVPEFLANWLPIIPHSAGEILFKEICQAEK